MASRSLCALLLLCLACDPQAGAPGDPGTPGDPVSTETTVPSWSERFALVRGDLDQLDAAHQAKDKDVAIASWQQAYQQRFELLIEQPVGERVDTHQVMAVEYAFGRLRDAIESPRVGPVRDALTHLREQLDALEPAVAQLPEPTR